MPTNDLATLSLCALAGAALGVFFFGGLWWTVRAIVDSGRSALLQFASLLLRMGVTLLGFYLAGAGDARRLVACLAGFVVARAVTAHWVRTRAPASTRTEASRAPRP